MHIQHKSVQHNSAYSVEQHTATQFFCEGQGGVGKGVRGGGGYWNSTMFYFEIS